MTGSDLAPGGFLQIGAQRIEYVFEPPQSDDAPLIVLLHEGLGCAALWGDFPYDLQRATGAGVFAFSRAGYGASSPVNLPRPLTYMHDEALEVLPQVLDAIGLRRGILVGHSDGASIAAIHAGGCADHRVRGICLIAPHFVVEDVSIAAIAQAKMAYETTDLKARLARWHGEPDNAFYGWNTAWLDPAFRSWDISEYFAFIRIPVLIIQGSEDQYGTLRQIEIARAECPCPVEAHILPGVKHTPHREAAQATVALIADFYNHIFSFHENGAEAQGS